MNKEQQPGNTPFYKKVIDRVFPKHEGEQNESRERNNIPERVPSFFRITEKVVNEYGVVQALDMAPSELSFFIERFAGHMGHAIIEYDSTVEPVIGSGFVHRLLVEEMITTYPHIWQPDKDTPVKERAQQRILDMSARFSVRQLIDSLLINTVHQDATKHAFSLMVHAIDNPHMIREGRVFLNEKTSIPDLPALRRYKEDIAKTRNNIEQNTSL